MAVVPPVGLRGLVVFGRCVCGFVINGGGGCGSHWFTYDAVESEHEEINTRMYNTVMCMCVIHR